MPTKLAVDEIPVAHSLVQYLAHYFAFSLLPCTPKRSQPNEMCNHLSRLEGLSDALGNMCVDLKLQHH
jgi:hypothetical protein